MFKEFTLALGLICMVSLVACSNDNVAGGTIDPNTFALGDSSSSVESSGSSETENGMSVSESSSSSNMSNGDIKHEGVSSSEGGNHGLRPFDGSSSSGRSDTDTSSSDGGDGKGVDPFEKSSSSLSNGGIARAKDFSIQCIDDVIYVDLDTLTVAADVAPPVAFKHVGGDAVKFALQGVYLDIPCDKGQRDEYMEFLNTDDTFPMGREGDTLYVMPLQSKGIDYACSCAANATFTLDKNYSGINYTVFDQEQILPVQEN